ncbi:MAG: hypothetical protein M3Z02_00370 [Actinomycetota bacterium]|nr:hypothetical protein [Actinomycetota bacterium]
MTELPSPPAARLRQPRWLDGRVVLGVLLIVASVVVGSAVVAGAQRTTRVLTVTRDLPRGYTLTNTDLSTTAVRLVGNGQRYIVASQRARAVGQVLQRDVGRDEFLPRDALAPVAGAPLRQLSFPVPRSHAVAGDLRARSRVDILATRRQGTGTATARAAVPTVVATDVVVLAVDQRSGGLSGSGDTLTLTVQLRPDQVLAVVAAVEGSDLDVVSVQRGAGDDPGDVRTGTPPASS